MYAIVDIAGQQFKVAKDQQIFVHRLQGDEGASIEFDKVLLAENEGKFSLGSALQGAKVSATILSHVKGEKVLVFKKKRRKGYKKKNGHRQQFTKIAITGITL
jgi:large subunit ribosomal protein L21